MERYFTRATGEEEEQRPRGPDVLGIWRNSKNSRVAGTQGTGFKRRLTSLKRYVTPVPRTLAQPGCSLDPVVQWRRTCRPYLAHCAFYTSELLGKKGTTL